METAKKYGRWGWWAIIGLVAILILIGLVIAAIASRNIKTADTEKETASVIETTVEDDVKEDKSTVKKEEVEIKAEGQNDNSNKKKDKKKSGDSSNSKKKEEPAVVTRCKSKAYMEKTLRGSTKLDCNSEAGIAEYRKLEGGGDSSSTSITPDSSAGPEVYEYSDSLPKSGPEDTLPIFVLMAILGFLATSSVIAFAKRRC